MRRTTTRYHGQAHVDAMLDGLGEIRHGFAGPEAAELAMWSHDAIYDPAASDNEARSAALFLDLDLAGLGADPATYDAYERGTAAEYAPVRGEARFRAGRRSAPPA